MIDLNHDVNQSNENHNKHKDVLDQNKSTVRVRSIRMCPCLNLLMININKRSILEFIENY